MAAATLTVYPEAASVHEGRLAIGGCDILELAREFGTPAYVVAEDDLRARAREFVHAMTEHHGERGRVAFASKACPCTEVLRIFRDEGLAVDVASLGELHLARRAGYGPAEIIFHGNAKSEAELAGVAGRGVFLPPRRALRGAGGGAAPVPRCPRGLAPRRARAGAARHAGAGRLPV